MNKILVPVDFTEVSMNALKYAVDSNPEDSEFHIVHVHSGNLNPRDKIHMESGMTVSKAIEKQLKEIIEDHFSFDTFPDNIKVRSLTGDTIMRIKELAEEEEFTAVFAGTRDKYDVFDRWFGTVSLGFAKTLEIPLFLIPRYSEFESYEKVLVASDYHLTHKDFIQQIMKWNESHRAYIKFLHVHSGDEDDYREESKKIISELFEKNDPEFGFEVSSVKSSNVSESLLANAYNFKADLMIMVAEKQNFLQTLLFQSVSKKVILKSTIPVLFLHD